MDTIQIALVDDHRLFRSGIASLINNFAGYNVLFEAANGEELTRKISPKFKPDIILLDINMPVMNGPEFCRQLRRDILLRHLPVIMLTGKGETKDMVTGIESGADDYLSKPISRNELYQVLLRHLPVAGNRPAH